jgi:hypothetical protein
LATALHEPFETRDNGIAGKASARVREVGGTRAVARSQSSDTVGTEPARTISRAIQKLVELDPRRGSFGNELV